MPLGEPAPVTTAVRPERSNAAGRERGTSGHRRGERLLDDVEALDEQVVADRQRRQEAEDVAVGAGGQGDDAGSVAAPR